MFDIKENLQNLNDDKKRADVPEKEKIMPFPEISVKEEKGVHLMSLMLKAYDPKWGNRTHDLAKAAEEYFKKNPLEERIRKSLDNLKILAGVDEEGIDEETLFNISLSYCHPERIGEISEKFLKKDQGIEDAHKLQGKVLDLMKDFEAKLNHESGFKELEGKFKAETAIDADARKKAIESKKTELEKALAFFKPKEKTTRAKKVNILPTDFLCEERSGMGFDIAGDIIVRVPLKDFTDSNQWTHEVLHSVINPITDKLFEGLTDDQKKKIIALSSYKLKQRYGRNVATILNECFIRTYVNYFEKGEGPYSYDYLKKYIGTIGDKEFQEALKYKEFKQSADEMGIKSLNDLSGKLKEYFERYEKDILGDLVYGFYEDYKRQSENDECIAFEDFVMANFPGYLDKYARL